MAAVVGEGDRLRERHAQVGRPRDADRDLGDLDRVRQSGPEMVVTGGDEHLALAGEPAPRAGVLDPVEVALEAQPVRIGRLLPRSVPGADRARGAGREGLGDFRLPLLPAPEAPTDVGPGAGMGPRHFSRRHFRQHHLGRHAWRVPRACDT